MPEPAPSSSNSHSVEDNVNVEATGTPQNRHNKDGAGASEINTVDGSDRVASSSKAEEGDGDDNDDYIQARVDKLLCKIEEPELSEEQIRINDQSQQDEVEITL